MALSARRSNEKNQRAHQRNMHRKAEHVKTEHERIKDTIKTKQRKSLSELSEADRNFLGKNKDLTVTFCG